MSKIAITDEAYDLLEEACNIYPSHITYYNHDENILNELLNNKLITFENNFITATLKGVKFKLRSRLPYNGNHETY